MKELDESSLGEARVRALIECEAILHALGCPKSRLREEALFDLAVLGWSEAAFVEDAWHYGPGRA